MAIRATGGDLLPHEELLPVEAGGPAIVVADVALLLDGDYSRAGDDLLLRDGEGGGLFIQGYFALEVPPPLMSPGGAALSPDLVTKLAAAMSPIQVAQAGPVGGAVPIGQVEDVSGTVYVVRGGRPVELAPGDPVFQNDIVETGLASELVIGFADGTIFSLAANARMLLDSMVYDPEGSSNELSLSILHGVFSFVTGLIAPSGEMRIETPVATLGIRGTTVHGILQSISGPLTVFLGSNQRGTEARAYLLDPLTRSGIATLIDLNAAYYVGALGAPPLQRPQSGAEQQFTLQRSGVIHDVQSSFGFRYGTGEPINQPGETLRTQAGPNQPSGGIGFDRETGADEALVDGLLRGLEGSPTLAALDGFPFSRLALTNGSQSFTSGAAASRIELTEGNAATGEGSTSTGQIVLAGGSAPVQSYALVGLTFMAGGAPHSLSSGGVPVTVSQNGALAQGFAAGVPVFRFQLNGDGSFTFSLFRPLDHPIAGATGAADTIDIGFDIVVTFIDGTTLRTSVLSVVLDSGPVATSDVGAVSEVGGLGVSVTGQLPILGGGDGVKSVELLGQSALVSAGGQPVSLARVSAETFHGVTADGTEVFRITLDPATGNYAFTLLRPIDHPGLGADSFDLVFQIAVTDGDNDTVIGTITIQVNDDGPSARDDGNLVAEGDLDRDGVGNQVTGNVILGRNPSEADVSGADGPVRVTEVTFGGTSVAVPANNSDVFIAGSFGSLSMRSDGTYTYTAPLSGTISSDQIVSFGYRIVDADGDRAAATLAIDLRDTDERVDALLVTDTDQEDQTLRIIVTRDDAEVLESIKTERSGTGQETGIALGDAGIVLEPPSSYALILKYASLQGSVEVTDFDLIFDLAAPDLDAPSNVFLSLLDQGTIKLGTQPGDSDGAIWQVDGTTLAVATAILYGVKPTDALGDVAVFDSAQPSTSFTLDFGLLPTGGNLPADPNTALFGPIGAIDIAGSQASEVNTLVVHAQDVLDVGGAGARLIVLGDNDTILVADRQNWVDGDPSDSALDPVRTGQTVTGSKDTFDVYRTAAGAELFVAEDLILQSQYDMALG